MRFEWDEAKNDTNARKHGVTFEIASKVFDDPHVVTFVERVVEGEERWHAIGMVSEESLLFLTVAHTYTELGALDVIRIISARPCTKTERRLYDSELFGG